MPQIKYIMAHRYLICSLLKHSASDEWTIHIITLSIFATPAKFQEQLFPVYVMAESQNKNK